MSVNHRQCGFTMVELIVSIIVLGILAAIGGPLVLGVGESYARASKIREAADDVAFGMERCIRLLRETPMGVTNGEPDIIRAEAGAVEFNDGSGLELAGTTLELLLADGTRAPLVRDVDTFIIQYIGADGVTDTSGLPSQTRRYVLTLGAGGIELRSAVFFRGAMAR